MQVEVSGNNIRFGIDEDALRQKVMSSAIYSINGVMAAPDGSFYIHGSECDSWGYVTDGKAIGTGSAEPETVAEEGASGIWIADLCPACQTCDTIYEIKQEIEYLDVIANILKDVTLHDDATLDAQKAELASLAIDGGANCPSSWGSKWSLPPWKGLQLLQQYITVAHMWNYAVVQNNASFKLEIAPEDTAGFVVLTKRSLPNCDNTWHIRCVVDVYYDHAEGDDGTLVDRQNLSVFVPEPHLTFKPFTMEESVAGTPTGLLSAKDAALNKVDARAHVQVYPDCTTKRVYTDEIMARVGGTYELSFKILPFRNYVIYDKDGNIITIRGATVNLNGSTVGGNVIYDKYAYDPAKTVIQQIPDPTRDDYLNAKTAPTGSVPLNNIWRVHVLWEVAKDVEPEPGQGESLLFTPIRTIESDRENTTVVDIEVTPEEIQYSGGSQPVAGGYFKYEETRMYTCTGAREPNTQALVTGSTVPVEIETDPPEPPPNDEAANQGEQA